MSKQIAGAAFRFLFLCLALAGCSLPNATNETASVISGAPVVTLASPLANATYLKDVIVNIQALVSNAGEGIERAEISVDNTVIATVPSPNPSNSPTFSITQTWPAESEGTHTISVTVFRADGSASEPATVSITVLAELPELIENDAQATEETDDEGNTVAAATASGNNTSPTSVAARPSNTPTIEVAAEEPTVEATEVAAEPTEEAPAATRPVAKTRAGGLNVRRGPSANFVPALGVLAGNQTVDILAYNPNGTNPPGTWYKIPFGGGEGWIFSGLVDMEGDLNAVPVETGPAIPTLAPPTAAATAVPAASATAGGGSTSGVNLVLNVVEFRLVTPGANDGNNIFANEAAFARVTVTNNGTAAPTADVYVVVAIANKADANAGGVVARSPQPIGLLAPGQTVTVDIPFTDNTQAGVERRAVILVDPNGEVAETNESDNSAIRDYILGAR